MAMQGLKQSRGLKAQKAVRIALSTKMSHGGGGPQTRTSTPDCSTDSPTRIAAPSLLSRTRDLQKRLADADGGGSSRLPVITGLFRSARQFVSLSLSLCIFWGFDLLILLPGCNCHGLPPSALPKRPTLVRRNGTSWRSSAAMAKTRLLEPRAR